MARVFELDEIVGLLLKALGLDKQRRFLNLGGLDLVEIKPSWIYPSLGLKMNLNPVRRHRRHKSLEYVTELIKRRNSVDNSSLALFNISGNVQKSHETLSKSQKYESEDSVKSLAMAGGVTAMLPTFTDTERKSPLEHHSNVKSTQVPPRYRQRYSQGASRPPGLATVISSPLATVKSNSMPIMIDNFESISVEDEKMGLLGSAHRSESRDSPDGQEGEGGREVRRDETEWDTDDDYEDRVPDRRHARTVSKTGATHVPFSTLAKYQRYSNVDDNPTSSITNLIDQFEQEGTHLAVAQPFYSLDSKVIVQRRESSQGSKLVHRAAIKSMYVKDKTKKFINSRSSSSDDLASTDNEELSFSLSIDLPKSSPDSSTKQPTEGEDLVDGGSTPASPPPPSLSVPSVNIPLQLKTLMYLDLSSNKLKNLGNLVEDSKKIIKSLKDVATMDLKQNSLTELPVQLLEVRFKNV